MSKGKNNTNENPKKELWLKLEIILACVVTIALVVLLMTCAWFYYSRELQTAAKVHTPYNIVIGAGHKDGIVNLDLGNINTESGTSQEYVFAVYGQAVNGYTLQLAHTTNISFKYKVYYAKEEKSAITNKNQVIYTADDGNTYYYTKNAQVSGDYIKAESDNSTKGTRHGLTYGTYNQVQTNAEPLYWQAQITPNSQTLNYDNDAENYGNGNFLQYYILRIEWDKDAVNNKETDLVYIMAG